MDETSANQAVRAVFSAMEAAWRKGDGEEFAEHFTPDADFVNIIGMHVHGKAAIAALHTQIFDSIYAGSSVALPIKSLRSLGSGVAVAVLLPEVQVPAGPFKGTVQTVATATLVRAGQPWRVASFHNTRRDSPTEETLARMRAAIQKE